MQPAKRRNSDNYTLCGPPAKTVPEPPVSTEDSKKSSLLKAFEAVVAAGRRGLLGPAARAAVEAMPDLDLECRDGKAGQETPSSVPLVEEKKEETKEKEEEKTPEEEGKKKRRNRRKKRKGRNTLFTVTVEGEEKKEEPKEKEEVMTPEEEWKMKRRIRNMKRKERHSLFTLTVAGTGSCQPTKKEIWIIGDSEIVVASKRAQLSHLGRRFGLPSSIASVVWRGFDTIQWDDLLPNLHELYQERPVPSTILLHLGESDLLLESSCSLATRMQNDLSVLQRALPDVVLIWSSLLTKPVWTPTEESQVMESKRNDVNCKMEEYCNENGICYLSHPLFTAENKVLFFPDNTLTNAGADVFTVALKKVLYTSLTCKKC